MLDRTLVDMRFKINYSDQSWWLAPIPLSCHPDLKRLFMNLDNIYSVAIL